MFHDRPNKSVNQSEPAQTGAHPFEQDWLSVEQAVVYCAELGLTRTPKTIRKWAERSSGLPDGEVLARKEDTPWGYKWQIEKVSLTRKVNEELELRAANTPELVRTGLPEQPQTSSEISIENKIEPGAHPSEPVHTGANTVAPLDAQSNQQNEPEPSANQPAPVQTRSEIELVLDEVRERMSDKDNEIAFLRDQLSEAQIEIGKRAASTDEALKTIDRVVRSFEMQAEANKALALQGSTPAVPFEDTTEPISYTPEPVDSASRHQDIRRV